MTRKSVMLESDLHTRLKLAASAKGLPITKYLESIIGHPEKKAGSKEKEEEMVTVIELNDGNHYTGLPKAIMERFPGADTFALYERTLTSGKRAVLVKHWKEHKDFEDTYNRMCHIIGQNKQREGPEVFVNRKQVDWLGCRHGDRIIWRIKDGEIWFEKSDS